MSDEETNGCGCYQCGLQYGSKFWIEAIVPDNVWEMIKPDGCEKGCDILCISCIAMKLREIGCESGTVPVWLCGTESLNAMQGDPGDQIDILRNWTICAHVQVNDI